MSADRVLSTLGEGDKVWVKAEKKSGKVYTIATVLAVDEATATARTDDDESKLVQIDLEKQNPWFVNPNSSSDMCGLYHIHEPGILQNLEDRSYESQPYTFMGSVLVAVNPLKKIKDPVDMLGSPKATTMNEPHPYVVAETAFQQMTFAGSREAHDAGDNVKNVKETRSSQSVVISGESGAGKTESAKMNLAHLVQRGGGGDAFDRKLLGTNPILEGFGNATTLRNPNSSRFGKLLKLHFEATDKLGREYKLYGASVSTYLLERSRISFHSLGERNYHIFYQMKAGLDDDFQKLIGVDGPFTKFRYLTPSKEDGTAVDSSVWSDLKDSQKEHDLKEYKELIAALDEIGLQGQDRKELFVVLGAILHMGNLKFEDSDSSEGDVAKVSNVDTLKKCGELFGVDAEKFEKVFTERHIKSVGETIVAKRNARAARYACDAVAKSTYSKLFDWMVTKIDFALSGTTEHHKRNPTIGVLDIFGFESFKINGFEQLLINYTNEALQATFNRQVFVAEAALYEKEGLFGSGEYLGRPQDNSVTLELLQGPPTNEKANAKSNPKGGLLMIIDSEGRSPDAGDAKFNKRIHQTYFKNPAFIRPHPKDAATTFIVRHYAGAVVYTIGSFLEKNNDTLPGEVDSLLSTSSSELVKQLYPPPVEVKEVKGRRRKPPAKSIVRKFQQQIKDLVVTLEATRCSFIRCVKPNASMIRDDSRKEWFDRAYVTKQLHSLNIPQTAEVLRNGFPTRIPYQTLVDSYKNVLPKDALLFFNKGGSKDFVSFTKALFHAFEITNENYKLGLTRVFFRSGQLATLDKVLQSAADGISDEIAKRFKSFYIHNIWKRSIAKVRAINKFIKSLELIRKRAAAIVKIQSLIRIIPHRRYYVGAKKAAVIAQKHWRGIQGRKKAEVRRLEYIEEQKKRDAEAKAAAEKRLAEAKEEEEKKRLQAEADKLEEERKAREVEAKKKEEERVKKQEAEKKKQEEAAAAAIKKMEEEKKEEAEKMKKKRRQTQVMTSTPLGIQGLRERKRGGLTGIKENESSIFGVAANARKTRATRVDKDRVQLARKGRKLRQKSIAPHIKKELARKDRLKALRSKIHGDQDEGKSAKEKFATLEKEEFEKPCKGHMELRSIKKKMLRGYTWKKRFFILLKPHRLIRVYKDDKSSNEVASYTLAANTKVTDGKDVDLKKSGIKKEFVILIRDHSFGDLYFSCVSKAEKERWLKDLRQAVTGFQSTAQTLRVAGEKKAPTGSLGGIDEDIDLPPPPDEVESEDQKAFKELYAEQLRQEKIEQLKQLLGTEKITKAEYDDMVASVNETFAKKQEKRDRGPSKQASFGTGYYDDDELDFGVQVACTQCGTVNNTAYHNTTCSNCQAELDVKDVENSQAPSFSLRDFGDGNSYLTFVQGGDSNNSKPLSNPLCKTPYQRGEFSVALSGSERGMDFATFEEFVMYTAECRYKFESGRMIGWTVARRFKQWRAFAHTLEGVGEAVSPFDEDTLKLLPQFPKKGRWDNLRGVRSQKVVSEREEQLLEWLSGLLKLAPTMEQTIEDSDDEDDEDDDEDDEDDLDDRWEAVNDPETGEVYYWNKETGVASWERPRKDSAPPPVPPKPPLMPGWEAVVDEDSGDVYYWHAETQTSTWNRPMLTTALKSYDVKQLLHVPAINKFFDIRKHVHAAKQKKR